MSYTKIGEKYMAMVEIRTRECKCEIDLKTFLWSGHYLQQRGAGGKYAETPLRNSEH